MLVDLLVFDKDLDEIILEDYPGRITGKQRYVDTVARIRGRKINWYWYRGLESGALNDFLLQHEGYHYYIYTQNGSLVSSSSSEEKAFAA